MKRINILFFFAILTALPSCFTRDMKEKMNESMNEMQKMLADQTFRKTLGDIELHKLRTGEYPASLRELKFINALDSAYFTSLEYHKLDSGYALNLTFKAATLNNQLTEVDLSYPPEFWTGLGCLKSNLKKE
jgi:hypothetical protein